MLTSLLLAFSPQDDPGIASSIKEIYVVEMSHCDIGFTDPPSVVEQQSHEHIVHALNAADARPAYKFTVESAWQLEQFDRRASAGDKNRLRARLAEGRFALGGGYCNAHSALWSEEEMHRFVRPAYDLARSYGAAVDTAVGDDVPGFSLAYPRVLSGSGVQYLLLGANDFIGGKPSIPLADRPYWWEARDGSRVLTWLCYGSYAEGYDQWGMLTLNMMYNRLGARLPEFEAAGYPYDAVLVMRGFDNADAGTGMADLAAQWNSTYQNPKIILATPADFFRHITGKYGTGFPVYRGDASGHWESVSTVTPATDSIARRATAVLPDLEALWSFAHSAAGAAYPGADFRAAWDLSMVFDEHSGGGMPWPGYMTLGEANQQNNEFVGYATELAGSVSGLRAGALALAGPHMVPAGESGLVLYNLLGADFDGVVEVDAGAPQPADLRLADPDGGPDARFRWARADRSTLALRAQVPARGWRRWRVAGGGSTPAYPGEQAGTSLPVGSLTLSVDAATGTGVSLRDAVSGVEWLADHNGHRTGGFERASNTKAFFGIFSNADPAGVSITVEDPSPVYRALRVYHPRGALLREYRLHESPARLDVIVTFPRDALPLVPYDLNSQHYSVAFTANLATPSAFWVDGPDGLYRPGAESLPGTGLGHFGASTGGYLVGSDGRWLAVTALDGAILNIGEENGAAQATVETDEKTISAHMISHADFAQLVGGAIVPLEAEPGYNDLRFEYRVRFGDGPAPARGLLRHDLAPPQAAWVVSGAAPAGLPSSATFAAIAGAAAELTAFKRSEAGDAYVLRLRAGSAGGTAQLRPGVPFVSAWSADLLERAQAQLTAAGGEVTVPLRANGVVTVLLRD
ncbi:MAG: hypothetical protein EYC70_10285 [Planctomycetota bacterium]|nr:MAG: hypothetical protein EYC70_10285 [Planctomycetota bacterium]